MPCSIAQVLRTSSRRWGTSRHTAQRKASGAATAEQQMSYAYPALAPSRAVVDARHTAGPLCERWRVANCATSEASLPSATK